MDDSSGKIDPGFFRACCKFAASHTKGRIAFLMHLSDWLHDRAGEPSFKPNSDDDAERQYVEAIVNVTEEAKLGDFDPRAELMECLEDIDS